VTCSLIAKACGKDVETVMADASRTKYLTPQEAVEYGMIDKVSLAWPIVFVNELLFLLFTLFSFFQGTQIHNRQPCRPQLHVSSLNMSLKRVTPVAFTCGCSGWRLQEPA